MYQPYPPAAPEPPPRRRGVGLKVALVGMGLAAGAITATAFGASAATSGTGTTTATTAAAAAASSSTASGSTTDTDGTHDRGAGGGHAGEKALSAALTAKLKAAALKAVPGGTVERVESDSGDATYEAHMTKADGTKVTVKFNSSGAVTGVESGMGK